MNARRPTVGRGGSGDGGVISEARSQPCSTKPELWNRRRDPGKTVLAMGLGTAHRQDGDGEDEPQEQPEHSECDVMPPRMRRGLVRGQLEGQWLLGLTSICGSMWEGSLGVFGCCRPHSHWPCCCPLSPGSGLTQRTAAVVLLRPGAPTGTLW